MKIDGYSKPWMVGEARYVQIVVWDEGNPSSDLSSATATMAIYDQSGTAVLASASATVSGTTTLTVKRLWNTASVAPGKYRAVFSITLGSETTLIQVPIILEPSPASQTF